MDTNTTVNIMLFEGGALIDALSDKPAAVTLADKIAAEDRKALAAGQIAFDLVLDPVEVGMALNALTAGQSNLSQSLGEKVRKALAAKLDELGIGSNTGAASGGGLTDVPSPAQEPTPTPAPTPAPEESTPPSDAPSAPASDTPSDAPADGSTDTGSDTSTSDGNTYEPL